MELINFFPLPILYILGMYLIFNMEIKYNIFFNYQKLIYIIIEIEFMGIGDWGLGIGDWGLGIGPNPHTPIPNPQSPIPIKKYIFLFLQTNNFIIFI